jgi:DNA mismatch repair ATPase MutL
MKAIGIISTAALSLILGTAALAYAQQDQDKPGPQDEKAQKDKSAKQEEKKAQQPDRNNRVEEKNARQQDKNNNKQEEKNAQQQNRDNNKQDEKNAQQRDKNNRQERNNQQAQRSGGNRGGRIPDDRFRASFGREHSFRVSQADYSRDRRFQYGGYSFVFVDQWPGNWLYTQDVFVVEIDGVYYLCNATYPGVNIALSIAE